MRILGTIHKVSYRKTSELINRIRYQEGATLVRTLRHNTEAEVIDFRKRRVAWILERNDFTEEGIQGDPGKPVLLSEEEIRKGFSLFCMGNLYFPKIIQSKCRVEKCPFIHNIFPHKL